ncbi:hypothetical protein COCVIDRAFT_17420 [Bipolaris victoriae FI3]|uniref:Uncharacterized protein n=1 Tax=Bipolaris victoriae (strain FI3) TaxID=930091 RepID=W7E4U6_BIPV3|nr:hypothetical protein COCVIDRAFT_17420 [Bipolaris victoriae FI3]
MANAKTILKALAGTYALINTTTLYNGIPGPDVQFRKDPRGMLVYTQTGYVSVVITDATNITLSFAGPLNVDPVAVSTVVTGEIIYGPFIASNVPALIGTKERTKYDISFSDGTNDFPCGTKILSTQSLGHNGTEELALWRSID